jgi:hypothetical protein
MEKERKCKNKTCYYFSSDHEFNCRGELYNGESAIEICEFWEVDDEEKI